MILVRYGEIGLKSPQTRMVMERKLLKNIEKALEGRKVRRERGRIFIESDLHEDAEKAARVFGVVSTSVSKKISSELVEILTQGVLFAKERIKEDDSFAVRIRRTGNQDYKSPEVATKLGGEIRMATGAKVNLENPDFTVYVEIRDKAAYIFDKVIQGVGGLPLGTQGKALALISGGIDSPVAAWLMMKRGVEITGLFMDCRPLVDDRTLDRAKKTIEVLAGWVNSPIKTYVVPYGDALLEFLKYGDNKMGCILCKRMMYRVGWALSQKENAGAFITGESMGQVASQTLQNINSIERGINYPVLRPLIGWDKNEIVDLAKVIGTYEASIQPANCCLGPPIYPETKATFGSVLKAEERLGMETMVEEALSNLKIIEVKNGKG
jgi:thiamine biosynthesis protein ThiI